MAMPVCFKPWWLLALLLSACAQPEGVAPAVRSDWTTASDEAPARKRARLRLELATAYYQQGQDAVALDEVKQALLHDAAHAAAWNLRGLIYLRQAQWQLSRESFERALALTPRDPDFTHNLGWLLCQQAQPQWTQAQELFRQALTWAAPAQAAKTWAALGVCQQRAGELEPARASLQQSLALEPDQPRALWPLAQVLFVQGRYKQAWEVLAQLHTVEKASADSLWLAVRTAHRLDNVQLASPAAQQLRQQFGGSRQAQALDKGWFDE